MNLEELIKEQAITGYESNLIKKIANEIDSKIYNINIDNIVNLYIRKKTIKQSNKNIMIVSHIDEVGLQIMRVNSDGTLVCKALGALKVSNLYMQRVKFQNSVGIVSSDRDISSIGIREIELLQVDCGFSSEYDARSHINIGEVGTFDSSFFEDENLIIGKSLDNRLGCWMLLNLLGIIKESSLDITVVFTVQEENGCKGAKVAAQRVNPYLAIVLDCIFVEYTKEIKLGSGIAIKVSDGLSICNPNIVNELKTCAKDNKLKFQIEVTDLGGTELSVIEDSNLGSKIAGLSIPIKYGHAASSMAKKDDLENGLALLAKYIRYLESNN